MVRIAFGNLCYVADEVPHCASVNEFHPVVAVNGKFAKQTSVQMGNGLLMLGAGNLFLSRFHQLM